MNHVNILGVPFLHTDQESFVLRLEQHIIRQDKTFIITANPEIVMLANKDKQFMTLIDQATYVTADGIGIVKAAQLFKQPLPGRVTGYDIMIDLLKLSNKKHYTIYLLGASESTLATAIENINRDYANITIVGAHDGYFDLDDKTIADDIAASKPDITFVALGVPRQEQWIANNLAAFDHGIFIGVGGSIDVIAGTVKRAPVIWQKLNLEWLYRLMKQPSRFVRMLVLPRFALKIIGLKIRGRTS